MGASLQKWLLTFTVQLKQIQYSITHNNYSTKQVILQKNHYYSYLKRKRRRALRNSFVWDILSIDTGIEFHKNGVFMKKEYLYGLMDDGFKLIDKE